MNAGKRRRGRLPMNQVRTTSSSAAPPLLQRKDEDDEEDVCFICFDGGSLVLCDRRGLLMRGQQKLQSLSRRWHFLRIARHGSSFSSWTKEVPRRSKSNASDAGMAGSGACTPRSKRC